MLLKSFSVPGKPLGHLPDLNTVSSWGQVGKRESILFSKGCSAPGGSLNSHLHQVSFPKDRVLLPAPLVVPC